MHKKLVRSAAIREESPVRSPARKKPERGGSGLGQQHVHVSRARETVRDQPAPPPRKTAADAEKETETEKGALGKDGQRHPVSTSANVIREQHVVREAKCDTLKESLKELKEEDGAAGKSKPEVNNETGVRSSGGVQKFTEGVKRKPAAQTHSSTKQKIRQSGADIHENKSLVKQSCIESPEICKLTVKSDSLPERTPPLNVFVHPEIARVRSMGDVPLGGGGGGGCYYYGGGGTGSPGGFPGATGHIERQDSLRAVTVHEEDVPVIVRRRGCTLRVRITSFHEDGEEEWIPVGQMILPIHVCTRTSHKILILVLVFRPIWTYQLRDCFALSCVAQLRFTGDGTGKNEP